MEKKKVKNDEYLLGDEALIEALGADYVAEIKRDKPELYQVLRNNPIFMPSDVIHEK